mgnify:CR=1 FL=1
MSLCLQSCSLSIVFFVSMFYFSVWKIEERTEDLNNFEKLLSPEQKEIYANIKQERRNKTKIRRKSIRHERFGRDQGENTEQETRPIPDHTH